MDLATKYEGATEQWNLGEATTVGELRSLVAQKYNLVEETVKLIGLTATKLPDPSTKLSDLPKFKAKPAGGAAKAPVIMVLGTRAEVISQIAELDTAAEAIEAVEAAERAEMAAREQVYREQQYELARRRQEELARSRHQQLLERQRRMREEAFETERRARRAAANNASNSPVLELFFTPTTNSQVDASGMAILPQSVLEQALNLGVSLPLAFRCSLWTDFDVAEQRRKAQEEEESVRRVVQERYPQLFADITTEADLEIPIVPHFEISDGTDRTQAPQTSQAGVSSPPSKRFSYCGVAEFTAEPNQAILPTQLLKELGYDTAVASAMAAGAPSAAIQVRMETINLERGTATVIQPLTAQWEFIPESQRAALLEHHLRHHLLLAQHSIISLVHNGRTYKFFVRKTSPGPVIGLADSELATEIYPYDEAFEPPTTFEEVMAFQRQEHENKTEGAGVDALASVLNTIRPTVALAPTASAHSMDSSVEDQSTAPLSLKRSHSDALPVAAVLKLRPKAEEGSAGPASPQSNQHAAAIEASFTRADEAVYVAVPISSPQNRFRIRLKHSAPRISPASAFDGQRTAAAGAAAASPLPSSKITQGGTYDVDIYCSVFERHPGPDAFDICCQSVGDKELVVDQSISSDFVTGGVLFIALQNYADPCECSAIVSVETILENNDISVKGQRLVNTPGSDNKESKDDTDEVTAHPNCELCETCRQWIPSDSMRLHIATCRRRFQACNMCGSVFPKSGPQYAKHMDQIHSAIYSCRCGQFKGTQDQIFEHRRTSCTLKPVQCKFCPLKFEASNLSQHQKDCALRQSQCRYCNEPFVRGSLRYHISTQHGVPLDDITVDMWY